MELIFGLLVFRWLKFDPFGDYLYTGIGNHVGLFRDAVTGEMIARYVFF